MKARFRAEWYYLNLNMPSVSNQEAYDDLLLEESEDFKIKIHDGRLIGGHTVFLATSRGLVRWRFLMDPNASRTSSSAGILETQMKSQEMGPGAGIVA